MTKPAEPSEPDELELYERFLADLDDMTVELPPIRPARSVTRFDPDQQHYADIKVDDDEVPDDDDQADRAVFDRERLHHYWTRGEGLAKWAKSPHPWTALYHHLRKYVGSARAKRMAAQWHKEVFGIWPGEKKGKNPYGPG